MERSSYIYNPVVYARVDPGSVVDCVTLGHPLELSVTTSDQPPALSSQSIFTRLGRTLRIVE